jgi:nucleoside-triphosphatase THEP1
MENNNNATHVPKRNALLCYEINSDCEIIFKINEKTELEQVMKPNMHKFSFNPNVRVYSFPLPDSNFLKEKNQVIFELSYNPLPLVTANYFSPKYSFQLKDSFSYYFLIGLRFQRNDKHSIYKEPPGKPIDDEVAEMHYFFMYIINNYLDELRRGIQIQSVLDTYLKQLSDLIEVFKMINKGSVGYNPRSTTIYFKNIDEIVTSFTSNDSQIPNEIVLMVIALLGIFNYDHFINRDMTLKTSKILLDHFSRIPTDLVAHLINQHIELNQNIITGLYVLLNFSIKDGNAAWINLITNCNSCALLFEEQNFYIRINEFIRRSGSSMTDNEGFIQAKKFLIKNYMEREKELKNPLQSFNAVLRNITILAVNKENLLLTLFEFYENGLIDPERLRSVKEEIRRKRWFIEEEENFKHFIQTLKQVIQSVETKIKIEKGLAEEEKENVNMRYGRSENESLLNEFKSLLYDLSNSIRYIFTLLKIIPREELEMYLIRRAVNSIYDFTLDDYSYILAELKFIPEDIKSEIVDANFLERIKFSLRRINLPFGEKTKESLKILLLNEDLFKTTEGSMEYIKEFIRMKPDTKDLHFIVKDLILPQQMILEAEGQIITAGVGEDEFKEIFLTVKNYLMTVHGSEILELIKQFSDILDMLGDKREILKNTLCADFWKTINQRYSPEVFLGLSQVFTIEENQEQKIEKDNLNKISFDPIIENSYIKYVRSLIESIATDMENSEKINQFFNSLCTSNSGEKVVTSNNASTENIINSLLDIIVQATDPKKLIFPFVIENPTKESFWYKLLKAKGKYLSFYNHTYIKSILSQLQSLLTYLSTEIITVHEIITISKHTPFQRDAFIAYLETAAKAIKMNSNSHDLQKMINEKVVNLKEKMNVINEVETFFNCYGMRIENAENIMNYLKGLRFDFKVTYFKNFVLPTDVTKLKDEIEIINKWNETIIFRNTLNFHIHEFFNFDQKVAEGYKPITEKIGNPFKIIEKSNQMMIDDDFIGDFEQNFEEVAEKRKTQMSLDEIFQLAQATMKEIKFGLMDIITNSKRDMKKIVLKNTMKFLNGIEKDHYEKEVALISILLMLSKEDAQPLLQVMKIFCDIANYAKFCDVMIKADSIFLFSLSNAKIYKEFLNLINNPDSTFDYIFKFADEVERLKNKYSSKIDVENIIMELSENKELVEFALNTPDEDIRNMVDAVDEHGDSFIRVQTIRDLLIVGSFVRTIKLKEYTNDREKNPIEEEFVMKIVNVLTDKSDENSANNAFQNIEALINTCSKQFIGIKHLYRELSNREEASKIKAKEICKDSNFDFSFNFLKKNYEVNVTYSKAGKKISFRDLCDLRDRVLLLLYNEGKEKLSPEEESAMGNLRDVLASFIKVVDISEKVIFILNDIFNNGFPVKINKLIKLKEGNAFNFEEFLNDVNGINVKWSEDLKEAYTKYYPLTYFAGKQFWQLENLFTSNDMNDENLDKSNGYFLLKYADHDVKIDKIKKYKISETQSPKEKIFLLGEALNHVVAQTPKVKNKEVAKLIKNSMNLRNSNFIFSSAATTRIYHILLSIYFTIENALPFANQLLYCTKNTSFHEIVAFLYRFVYSSEKKLFTILRVENLSFELQNYLVEQVNKLNKSQISGKMEINSFLTILSSDSNSYIHTQFLENHQIYHVKDFEIIDEAGLKKILKILDINSFTIRSDDTGAGKSFFIRKKYEYMNINKDIQYINFPILDSVNIEKITERLYELNQYNSKKFIHFNINGIIDDYEMLDYILFNFIILKCLKHDICVSFRNAKEPIYIEIANTFNDYLYNAISILPLLPNEEMVMAKDYIFQIELSKFITDPMQIVLNYLFHFDQNTLNQNDVNPEALFNARVFNSKDEALLLLNKYFLKDGVHDITFRQVEIFIQVLADQLYRFGNNFYFTVDNIKYMQDNTLNDLRSRIMASLLIMTEEFTVRSIKSAREGQNITSMNLGKSVSREDLMNEERRIDEINALSNVLSWSKSNHLLIMFHEDGMCMTPVYREKSEVPQSVKQLVESQKSVLEDFQRMDHWQLLGKLCSIVGVEFREEFYLDSNYVITADNFLKMLLIIIRSRCNVPIVIMGETGCGKTSLVRFLATKILNQGFEVINFHAGIKEQYILDRINEVKQKAYDFFDSRIFVFLDEINTCDCLGLITEIICQKTLLGEPLPYNLIFIAACNPYKIRKDTGDVGLIKQRVATKLVYRVHPLPDSLIDYVWDYGSLSENEEKLYIGNILSDISGDLRNVAIDIVVRSQVFIRDCEDRYSVSLRDVARFKILHEWFYKIIEEKNEGSGQVEKEEKGKKKGKPDRDPYGYYNYSVPSYYGGSGMYSYYSSSYGSGYYSSYIKYTGKLMMSRKALILSLLLCYYNRISKNEDRVAYKAIITRFLNISTKELEEMINEEQRDIVTRMELPPAIAINKALLENVFTLLVCVINKIPLFICGKPGCSKSLAIQLLVSNLRGPDSTDSFFKKLPRILGIPYQGSESSTSEGIEKIFEKANNVLRSGDKSILPLVVFDEIGLAEISKNNPLKILHSLLEPDNPVIAFVGISNWRLDASKMNRAVYLARPDPDLEDLESTALSIFEYYIKEPRYDEKKIMSALAKTYYAFKIEQTKNGYPDFHGTRDFYSLIKQVTKEFNIHYNDYNEKKFSIVKDALCRNFGGLGSSIESILKIFSRSLNLIPSEFSDIKSKTLMELVKENLRDQDSRFLLLFTNGESASYILDNYLKNDLKERVFIIGSEFEEDKDKEEHSFRLLSDIILYMENGSSIILKSLDQIYGSLYDLFNQNFMLVGQKKNCRIALGSTNNPMCFVHNNFHCVVLVDLKDMDRMDPPFLNRFEKQILTFDSVLNNRQRLIVNDMKKWIKSLIEIAEDKDKSADVSLVQKVNIEDLIITYNDELPASLALLNYDDNKNNDEILEKCKRDILSVCNINFIIYSVLSQMYQTSRDEVNKIHKIFFEEQHHDSLNGYLEKTPLLSDSIKLIVYTYSNILDEILLNNPNLNDQNKMMVDSAPVCNISTLNIAEIKSEKDFDHRFKIFIKDKNSDTLIIKIDAVRENTHVPMIKFKVDKFLNEARKLNKDGLFVKNVIMIIYLSRGKLNQNSQSKNKLESHFLSGWNQIMIDSINGGQISKLNSLLTLNTLEIVNSNLDNNSITEIIFNIYLKFNFNTINAKDTSYVKDYITDTMRNIENDSELFNILNQKCVSFLSERANSLPDWKVKICCDNKIISKSLNTFNAIKLFVADLIEEPLLKTIHFLETESALTSFFSKDIKEEEESSSIEIMNKLKKKIFEEIFAKKDLKKLYPYNVLQSLIITPVFGLKFPFSKGDIYDLSNASKEKIDAIYVLDNAMYFSEDQINQEENKQMYLSEMEGFKKVISNSLLYKILGNIPMDNSSQRQLISEYLNDVINYFVSVELKKQFKWAKCLMTIVENYTRMEIDNLENVFIFLWKNKKIFSAIFDILEIMENVFAEMDFEQNGMTITDNKEVYVGKVEKVLTKGEIYQKGILEEEKLIPEKRRQIEVRLFLNIFEEIAQILLIHMNTMKIDKHFGAFLNIFITSLLNFSLEIKEYPFMLNIFVIINEYLKILSLLFKNQREEISDRVKNVFMINMEDPDKAINLIEGLKNFAFLPGLLLMVDLETTNMKNKLDDFTNIKESINSSKLTIFENVLIALDTIQDLQHEEKLHAKAEIINNIIKDKELIRSSSMIFYKLLKDLKIDESFNCFFNREDPNAHSFIEILERAIQAKVKNEFGYDHIIYSYLSDLIRKFMPKPIIIHEYLVNHFSNYTNYLKMVKPDNIKFVNILGFAGLKQYLEVFGEYLYMCLTKEKDDKLISDINWQIEELAHKNEVLGENLKNFILKSIMKKAECNSKALSRINFNYLGIKWVNNKLFENNDNALGYELIIQESEIEQVNKTYLPLFTSLINDEHTEENLIKFKDMIQLGTTNSVVKFVIIQFFINKIYLSFSNASFVKSLTYSHILEIYNNVKAVLKSCFSENEFKFIEKIMNNFTEKGKKQSFFTINPSDDSSRIGMQTYLVQQFNAYLTLGFGANVFPWDDKDLYTIPSKFLPGGFVDYHDENLLVMMKHINDSFEVYGSQLGLYECSCGYLYTIGDCTRPYYTAECPNCKNQIGGASHVLSNREGHVCLINADNKNDANRKELTIEHLKKKLQNKSGYISKMPDEIPVQFSIRSLSPLGFRWFNIFSHSLLLMKMEMNCLSNDGVKTHMMPNIKIKNYFGEDYFKAHINADMKALNEILKTRDLCVPLIIILSDCLSLFSKGINNLKFTDPNEREETETKIQTASVTPLTENLQTAIQDYKMIHSLDKKLSYNKILEESFKEGDLIDTQYIGRGLTRVFRSSRLGDWEDLKSEYIKLLHTSGAKNYQFLKLLIEKFDEICLLSNLYPLVQFSNYMTNLCNYRLTRQEAKEKKIREILQDNQVGEALFYEFAKAWKRISHKCTQYMCKALPVLEKIDLDLPVSFVLLDDRELGYGMYLASAFHYLGMIQNEVLEAIVYLIKENTSYQIWGNMDIHKYSIQRISPHEIIMYRTNADYVTSITDHFAKFYEIYNPNYGQGLIVHYNFEKIENELAFKLLTNKKLLNYEDLNKIQYKFELLSINNKNSNLLNDIKERVHQKPLSLDENHSIRRALEKLETQNVAYLHNIFSSLEIVLCNMRYSEKIENSSISSYIQRVNIYNNEKISYHLKDTQPLCSVKLSHVLSFYELVEDKLFKHVMEFISPEYNIQLDKQTQKDLKRYLEEIEREPYTIDNLINTCQRFVIRCLVATIDPKCPVKEYLVRMDFWDSNVTEQAVDSFYDKFPFDVLIANTIPLIEYAKEFRKLKLQTKEKEKIDLAADKDKYDKARLAKEKKQNKFS